jgi:Dyp-type peroxidase family
MPQFNRENIQGNILRPYTHRHPLFVFLHVEDAGKGREWLQEIIGRVTTATPWDEKPRTTLNVMFSYQGLKALGLSEQSLDSFPEEFQQGMAARASILGDTGPDSPTSWENGLGTPDIHILVSIYALDPDAHGPEVREPNGSRGSNAWLTALTERVGGVRVLFQQRAARLTQNDGDATTVIEHFGYVDGLSQPDIAQAAVELRPGRGAPKKGGTWRPIEAGEFLLGHRDEDGLVPLGPTPHPLAQDGTYVVYRKLHQHVAAFREFLSEQAYSFPGGEEALAARIMGRWRDGTPVALSPHCPDPKLAADTQRNNDFRFGDDLTGYRCPLGAHIRRANPRDSLPSGAVMVNRHRILRRGIPYGELLPKGAEDDGKERGLLFISLQASISRQFEFIQQQWMLDGNKFGLGSDRDLMAGGQNGQGKMTLQGCPPRFLSPLGRFVTVKGGEYFYMPGIAGLRFMATGREE